MLMVAEIVIQVNDSDFDSSIKTRRDVLDAIS